MLLTHEPPVSRQLGVFDKLEQAALAVARHRGTVSTEEKEGVGKESRAPKARKKRRRPSKATEAEEMEEEKDEAEEAALHLARCRRDASIELDNIEGLEFRSQSTEHRRRLLSMGVSRRVAHHVFERSRLGCSIR